MRYIYIVTINMVITACFARRLACHNWLVDNLPPSAKLELKSYITFTRDMNANKAWRIELAGNSYYEIKRFPLIKRYQQGLLT